MQCLPSQGSLERGKNAIDLLFDLRKFILPFMESAQMPKGQGIWHIHTPKLYLC